MDDITGYMHTVSIEMGIAKGITVDIQFELQTIHQRQTIQSQRIVHKLDDGHLYGNELCIYLSPFLQRDER